MLSYLSKHGNMIRRTDQITQKSVDWEERDGVFFSNMHGAYPGEYELIRSGATLKVLQWNLDTQVTIWERIRSKW